MTWQEVLKSASKYESAVAEEFAPEEMNKKDDSPLLQKLNKKQKKKIKKLLQSAQPSEYLGQEYTKAGALLTELKSLGLMKSKGEKKLLTKLEDNNVDIIAASAELRKDYENMYRRIRGLIYPKRREVFSDAGTNTGESNREMDDFDREASREQRSG
jgi:Txe/YoeB family toxin of Txe-Axe toxin-antitoxin module